MPLPTSGMILARAEAEAALEALEAAIALEDADLIVETRRDYGLKVARESEVVVDFEDYQPATRAQFWHDIVFSLALAIIRGVHKKRVFNFSEAWQFAQTGGTASIEEGSSLYLKLTGDGTDPTGPASGIALNDEASDNEALGLVGLTYSVFATVDGSNAVEGTPLRFVISTGVATVAEFQVKRSEVSPGYQHVLLGSFVNPEWDPSLLLAGFELQNQGAVMDPSGANATGTWLVNRLEVRLVL